MRTETDREPDGELLQFEAVLRQAKPVLSAAAMERVAAALRAEMAKQPAALTRPASVSLSYVKFRVAAAALIAVTVTLVWTLQRQPISISVASHAPQEKTVRSTYSVDVPRFPPPRAGAPLLRTAEYESLFQ